jgi:NCS1 family nucleobase:cation symporter-1
MKDMEAFSETIMKSRLYNEDLAPVNAERRTWNFWHVAALWVGMAICIPTYTMASGLISQGMDWKQAILTIFLGNFIVLIPMTLNARPGTSYGIPFPVLLRSSFGTLGSNIAALMRGIVACGWFGIQTWVGGSAIYGMAAVIFKFDPTMHADLPIVGISQGELLCFLIFWLINMFVILKGMECIKWLETVSAPFLIAVGLGLLVWAYQAAGGWGPILNQPSRFKTFSEFLPVFAPSLTAMVGFWSTLSLNIPDFSRYARSHKDQLLGQAIGLPGTMAFYSFIGVAVTSATVLVFGEAIWDPVSLLAKFDSPLLVFLSLLSLLIATLSTNIAANVVSPANDFSNLSPKRISFKMGGMITGFIGVLIFPWKLYQDPNGYIFTWLIGYSALLGPIAGIMIADYFVYRKQRLSVRDLYKEQGQYTYYKGFNLIGLIVLVLSVLPNVPGFLATIKVLDSQQVPAWLLTSYGYAWFVGFALAFLLYLIGMKWFSQQSNKMKTLDSLVSADA